MKKKERCGKASRIGLLCALPAIGAVAPAFAAEWQMTPSSSISSGYTGNPQFLPEGGDDELRNLAEVGLSVNGSTERLTMSITPRATFSKYRSDKNIDSNDQFLGIASSWSSEHVVWSGETQASSQSTQDSELGTSGLVQADTRRELVSVGAGPRWSVSETFVTGANLRWSDTAYADTSTTGLSDFTNKSASVYGTFVASERMRVTLSANGSRVESLVRDSRNKGASLGLAYDLGPRWSLSASAGPSWAESEGTTRQGTLFSADISRRGEKTQWSATASRQLDPIGTGVLATTEAIALNASRAITERFSISLTGQASRNQQLFDEADFANREVSYYSVVGSLRWQVIRDWTLTLSLEERSQEISRNGDSQGRAEGYRAALGIAWNGRTLLL